MFVCAFFLSVVWCDKLFCVVTPRLGASRLHDVLLECGRKVLAPRGDVQTGVITSIYSYGSQPIAYPMRETGRGSHSKGAVWKLWRAQDVLRLSFSSLAVVVPRLTHTSLFRVYVYACVYVCMCVLCGGDDAGWMAKMHFVSAPSVALELNEMLNRDESVLRHIVRREELVPSLRRRNLLRMREREEEAEG